MISASVPFKVYFLWITRTQRSFEWMTDIIRDVEEKDKNNFVDTHIFITQFKQFFDIRTTMLVFLAGDWRNALTTFLFVYKWHIVVIIIC